MKEEWKYVRTTPLPGMSWSEPKTNREIALEPSDIIASLPFRVVSAIKPKRSSMILARLITVCAFFMIAYVICSTI